MTAKTLLFAVLTTTLLTHKAIHITANAKALPARHLLLWTFSFFAQDLYLLTFARSLFASFVSTGKRPKGFVRLVASALLSVFAVYAIAVGFIGICFFAFNGSEVHYRNLGFVKDSSARAVLLAGFLTATLTALGLYFVSWLWQNVIFTLFGLPADAVVLCWALAKGRRPRMPLHDKDTDKYLFHYDELHSGSCSDHHHADQFYSPDIKWERGQTMVSPTRTVQTYMACFLAVTALLTQAGFLFFRPPESAFTYLSWTSPILPFIDFDNSSPNLARLPSIYGAGIGQSWDNITALGEPPHFSWLPGDTVLRGFGDWYESRDHYRAAADPLRSVGTQQPLIEGLSGHLEGVNIQHVMLIMLESTRKDVFPIKKNELIWNRFARTFPDGNLPADVAERLATMTPMANHLTGDYDDGFNHTAKGARGTKRGGLNFQNAYTAATYTKKSETGTLCGIHPLVADFNREYDHHIYQPCLPHIIVAFNHLDVDEEHDGNKNKDFASHKWRSSFMESTTINYDHSGPLFEAFGFQDIISKEYLQQKSAKFGKVELPDINYFGMEETPLRDYIRDAFVKAKAQDERVFITHITSTSHHPYKMPANETYLPLGNDALNDLSHYVNAIGYDDRWLGQIFDILEQEGVSNETLVVLHGDHGISIPENDILASYYNPNVGCDRVPLVISHPGLPSIQVDSPVSTIQVLPTILDLLVETKSLSPTAEQAARDLIANYEGDSLLRIVPPEANESQGSSQQDWQFVVMNPGRAMVGVRSRQHKDWRLIVPVLANVVWRFTDLVSDPTEADPVVGFDYVDFLARVEQIHGLQAAQWAEEAAFVTRWWVEENNKKWEYGPYASQTP